MKTNISDMQRSLAQLDNGFKERKNLFKSAQWILIEKALKLLKNCLSQLQSKQDIKGKDDQYFDYGLEDGIEYRGDTDNMDDVFNIFNVR